MTNDATTNDQNGFTLVIGLWSFISCDLHYFPLCKIPKESFVMKTMRNAHMTCERIGMRSKARGPVINRAMESAIEMRPMNKPATNMLPKIFPQYPDVFL